MLKHGNGAELRADVDALLPRPRACLTTTLARLHVHYLAQNNSLEAGNTREKQGGEYRRT